VDVDVVKVEVEVEIVDVDVINVVVVDENVVVIVLTGAVGAQEQAELYFEGSEPHAAVNLGMNPVAAVDSPCV